MCVLGKDPSRGLFRKGTLYLYGLLMKEPLIRALSLSGFWMVYSTKKRVFFIFQSCLFMFQERVLICECMFPLSLLNTCSSKLDLSGPIQVLFIQVKMHWGGNCFYFNQLKEQIANCFCHNTFVLFS